MLYVHVFFGQHLFVVRIIIKITNNKILFIFSLLNTHFGVIPSSVVFVAITKWFNIHVSQDVICSCILFSS